MRSSPEDGAMYFTIGGRRVQSGLYRVTYTGKESTAPSHPGNEKTKSSDVIGLLDSLPKTTLRPATRILSR